MKEKWLFTFEVDKLQKVKETTTEKNEAGEEISITKEVEQKVPQKFSILNPTRKMQDEASIFYSVKVSEGIRLGLVTKNYLLRKFQQEGLTPSSEEKKVHSDNYSRAIKLEVDMESIKLVAELSDAEKELQISVLKTEYDDLRQKIFDYENLQSSLFDNTAEKRANDLLNLWFVLNLIYSENDEVQSCLFGDGTFDQRIERFNAIEDSGDEFLAKVIEKGSYYIGRINSGLSKEDIKASAP